METSDNVFQSMQHNIFDAIGKPSVNIHTLQNRSSLIIQGTKAIIVKDCCSLPSSIIQQCVHVPLKHSETDFVILQPNPFEHH